MTVSILSREVIDDIRSAAWLESELHEDLSLHRRHEMADVCETGNIEKIWRVLGLCDAEIRMAIGRVLITSSDVVPANLIETPKAWEYSFAAGLRTDTYRLIKELIHDYFVAMAMADRAAVIIPECASIWKERGRDALTALEQCAAAEIAGVPVRRRLCPF